MSNTVYSSQYLKFNTEQTKQLALVCVIDGVDPLASTRIFTKIRYGDPDLFYGQPLEDGTIPVYGGLRPVEDVRDILSLDGSSLNLTQTIEPEQGRGSISTLSLSFIDKDLYMTKVISPGIIIPEILGASVRIYLGYTQLSYPEDYTVIFQGRISAVSSEPGLVNIQISDANIKRKEHVFYMAITKLVGAITDTDTTINVIGNVDFTQQILGPDNTYDPAVKTYFKIDDEYIEYPATGFGTNQFTSCIRGARGTIAAAHDDESDVSASIQIGPEHGFFIALKIMLSGWNGPWKEDVEIQHIVFTGDGTLGDQTSAIILPDKVDAVRDYGLVTGDYITITGDAFPANNITSTIVRFAPLFDQPNRIIYVASPALVHSEDSTGVMAFRSQYDTFPENCSSRLTPLEVDIEQHEFVRRTFLLGNENRLEFFLNEQDNGKGFIESEIYLPLACYSLTRFGKLSVGITKPPIADQRLVFMTKDNILNANGIRINRAVNNRKFFNEINWEWDHNDNGEPTNTLKILDADALDLIGISSVLPINSKGSKTSLGSNTQFEKRSNFLLQRYKRAAAMIDTVVNWEAGSIIESGDVVALQDNGDLQITNFDTGLRNNGLQLYEVIDRSLDIRSGNVKTRLIAGVGANAIDRFATISPSSTIVSATTTQLRIQDSYGAVFPGDEARKWRDYIGQSIIVHDLNYTQVEQVTLLSFDDADPYLMNITSLSFTPLPGYVVDIPNFPSSTDPYIDQIYKAIHVHFDPHIVITAGVSTTVFEVSVSDINKFQFDQVVQIHSSDFTIVAPEVIVKNIDIVLNRITVDKSLTFTPTAGYFVELIGFPDGSAGYRYI